MSQRPCPPIDLDEHAVLVVVDMQRVFVADAPIAAPAGAEVAARLNRLAAACCQSGLPVIWTRHVVRPGGSNIGLLGEMVPPVAGGIIDEDAPTAALHELMDVHDGDIIVDKPRFGAFYGTDLEVILRSNGIDTIILGGINTNVCVDTTAREAAVREFRVLFLSDDTANFDLPDGGSGRSAPKTCSGPQSQSWPSDSPRSTPSMRCRAGFRSSAQRDRSAHGARRG